MEARIGSTVLSNVESHVRHIWASALGIIVSLRCASSHLVFGHFPGPCLYWSGESLRWAHAVFKSRVPLTGSLNHTGPCPLSSLTHWAAGKP